MKVTITINCDNAAFGESIADSATELELILIRLSQQFTRSNPWDCRVFDTNGNTCGKVTVRRARKESAG